MSQTYFDSIRTKKKRRLCPQVMHEKFCKCGCHARRHVWRLPGLFWFGCVPLLRVPFCADHRSQQLGCMRSFHVVKLQTSRGDQFQEGITILNTSHTSDRDKVAFKMFSLATLGYLGSLVESNKPRKADQSSAMQRIKTGPGNAIVADKFLFPNTEAWALTCTESIRSARQHVCRR